ncbi:MAG: GFA family protein [Alphaproteobacteria bacterium]|nr:GFA family protein [Alphaproteobacteria bacterium]
MQYKGGCHCGNVRFEVNMEIDKVVSCNCSICSKKGHLMAFTSDENFKLISGSESLGDYQFGKKNIHHFFCKHCGISSFGKGTLPQGTVMRAINVRCLDDIDVSKFPVTEYDGKSL